MVALLIPLIPAIAVTLGIVIGLLWIFGMAIADTIAPNRGRPANEPIPGLVVPKWGAHHRRMVRLEHASWDSDFARAQVKLRRAGGPQGSSAATHG